MLALIGTLLSSIVSGGATGLLGVLLQRFFDMKAKQNDLEILRVNNAHALAMAQMAIEQTKAEWASRENIASTEASARMEAAHIDAMARADEVEGSLQEASYKNDRATFLSGAVLKSKSRVVLWSMAVVDATRGLVRPVLTAYLVAISHLMYLDMAQLLESKGAALEVSMVQQLVVQIISTLLYLATVAVVWWFGTRPPARK